MHRSTLKYALTAALATGAIATSPALAMPVDSPVNRGDSPSGSLAGTTEKNLEKMGFQDLRGERAKDAAFQAAKEDKLQPGQPVFPSYVPPLPEPKTVNASAPADDGDDVGIWLLLLSGLAGAGLAGGGAAGIARRSRLRARRVTA